MTMKLGVQEKPAFYNVLRTVRLGDVAQSMKNGIYKSKDAYSDDGIACLRMYNIGDGRIIWRDIKRMVLSDQERDEYSLEPGDLLVNRVNSRELVGKTALVTTGIERSVFESKNIRVRLDHRLVEPAYVNYALLALGRAHFNQNAQQVVGMASVSQPQVAAFQFLLRPVAQQREVVAYLDEQLSRLDASVAALHGVQANLKRYRASVLKSACEGRLVPTEAELARREGRSFETGAQLLQRILIEQRARCGQRKYKESTSPALADLPELPAGWHWGTMPQLGELNRGKSKHRPRDDEKLYGGPHPFIQTGDVRHADGVLSRHTQTYSDLGLAQSRLWPAGTLCITIAANIAETARLSYPACFPDSIVGFVCDSGEAMTKWVQIFLATAKENLETFAPGTAQKNINLEVLQNVAIPLPPLAEQHRIVAEADRRLSLIRVAEAQVAANLARAQRLRQSILQAAFRTPAQAGQ